jgi:hypothetical protein
MKDYHITLPAGSDSSLNSQTEAGPGWWHSKLSLLKEGHQAQVHSDQMVLVMAWHEDGPRKSRPKALGS